MLLISKSRNFYMSVLVGLAGLVIALYTIYNGLGLWMARHVTALERGEEPMVDEDGLTIYDHLPPSHLEMMKYYSIGYKGVLWHLAFLCLIASIGALIAQSQYAIYLYGIALGLDCLIFITYDKKAEFLANTSEAERMFDIFQYSVLLGAFLILAWNHMQLA